MGGYRCQAAGVGARSAGDGYPKREGGVKRSEAGGGREKKGGGQKKKGRAAGKKIPPREIKKGGREIKKGERRREKRGSCRGGRDSRGGDFGDPLQESLKIDLLEGRASCEALPLAQNLEWSMSTIICEYVDAQIDESRSYCEDKPHISHLLSWDRSLGRPFDLPRGSRYSSSE